MRKRGVAGMFQLAPLSPMQKQSILNSNARINIWDGSVRAGKTIASIFRWLVFLKYGPPGNLLMAGKTQTTLYRNVLCPIRDIVGEDHFNYSGYSKEATILGRTIICEGANDESAEGKIRGLTLAGAYGDEVTLWPSSFFKTLLSRLSIRGAQGFFTTNPDSPFHWLKADFIDRGGSLSLTRWHFKLKDNFSLDPAFVEALCNEYTGLWHRRFVEGEWVQAQGAVYDMWDEEVHVYDALPNVKPVKFHVGGDYGTANPCVFLYAIEDEAGDVWLEEEYYWDSVAQGKQKTDAEYVSDFGNFVGKKRVSDITFDPSAASFILALRKKHRNIIEADNAVLDGIRRVATALSARKLHVNRKCVNTIREFGSYVWDERAQARGEDAPVKQNDHALDSLRYLYNTTIGKGAHGTVQSF